MTVWPGVSFWRYASCLLLFIITPCSEVVGCILVSLCPSVHLSVRPRNRVCSVTSLLCGILLTSFFYKHLLIREGVSRTCIIFFRKSKIRFFGEFLKFEILLAQSCPFCNLSHICSIQFILFHKYTPICEGVSRVNIFYKIPKFEFFLTFVELVCIYVA